jgi:hypothetical protein
MYLLFILALDMLHPHVLSSKLVRGAPFLLQRYQKHQRFESPNAGSSLRATMQRGGGTLSSSQELTSCTKSAGCLENLHSLLLFAKCRTLIFSYLRDARLFRCSDAVTSATYHSIFLSYINSEHCRTTMLDIQHR